MSSVESASSITIGAISGQLKITFKFWNNLTKTSLTTPDIFLRLILTSPRGTRSSLLLPRPKDKLATSFEDWPFLSVHYWGEDPTGQWTLQVLSKIVWIFLNLLKSVESWLKTVLSSDWKRGRWGKSKRFVETLATSSLWHGRVPCSDIRETTNFDLFNHCER